MSHSELFNLFLDKFVSDQKFGVQLLLVWGVVFEQVNELFGFEALIKDFLNHGEADVLGELEFGVGEELIVELGSFVTEFLDVAGIAPKIKLLGSYSRFLG
jgi:hypothetical protein